jgi:hypothetical protein
MGGGELDGFPLLPRSLTKSKTTARKVPRRTMRPPVEEPRRMKVFISALWEKIKH